MGSDVIAHRRTRSHPKPAGVFLQWIVVADPAGSRSGAFSQAGVGQRPPGRRMRPRDKLGPIRQRPEGITGSGRKGVMGGGVGNLVQSGPLLLAVPIAAAAGAITFLSPCCLPLVPGYLSYVTGMSGTDAERPALAGAGGSAAGARRGRTVLGTALFVLGFSVIFPVAGRAFVCVGVGMPSRT